MKKTFVKKSDKWMQRPQLPWGYLSITLSKRLEFLKPYRDRRQGLRYARGRELGLKFSNKPETLKGLHLQQKYELEKSIYKQKETIKTYICLCLTLSTKNQKMPPTRMYNHKSTLNGFEVQNYTTHVFQEMLS